MQFHTLMHIPFTQLWPSPPSHFWGRVHLDCLILAQVLCLLERNRHSYFHPNLVQQQVGNGWNRGETDPKSLCQRRLWESPCCFAGWIPLCPSVHHPQPSRGGPQLSFDARAQSPCEKRAINSYSALQQRHYRSQIPHRQ